MSLSAELFLSSSILQLTFYAISTAYQRKAGFVLLNTQIYYIGSLLLTLAVLLLLNEDLLLLNSLTSNNFIVNDYFGFATKIVICVSVLLFFLIINTSLRDQPVQNNFEYLILLSISVLGLLLLCSANDLITAYLAIELHSIAFYIMAAFKRNSSYSTESGLKYFIIGALSSALFLFGSALIYGTLGSLNFDDLQMFLSLIYTSSENSLVTSLKGNYSVLCSMVEYLVGNYTFTYNESLLSLINNSLLNVSADIAGSSNLKTTENLIDWCALKQLEDLTVVKSLPIEYKNNNWLEISTLAKPSWVFQQNSLENFVIVNDSSFNSKFFSNLMETERPEIGAATIALLQLTLQAFSKAGTVDTIVYYTMFDAGLISLGFLLVCVSLFIKLSIAPFHFWSLDVYEGSPNVTTVFFAVVPKIALFVLLTRLCYISFYPLFVNNFQSYFLLLAGGSVFVGSFGGLEQRKVKTLLAYSSISHTGYLFLAFSTGNFEGVQMLFYYLIIYMISSLCFWAVYLFLRRKPGTYIQKSNKELGDFVLLNESNACLAMILAITLFSIAGIPPLVGFLAKIGIFLVVVESSAYLLAVLIILFSVVSTFYYIRFIKILYFENAIVGNLYLPISTTKAIIVSALSLLLVILCLNPTLIYLLFYKAVLLAF